MKHANLPQKDRPTPDRRLLKRLAVSNKKFSLTDKSNRRLKIVRGFTVGRVRGGHSFH